MPRRPAYGAAAGRETQISMNEPPEELKRRLLFVLHRGWVEARLLAQAKKYDQLFDLADALEPLPAYMSRWEDAHYQAVLFNLTKYQRKYPSQRFEYLDFLERFDPGPF